jgi:osmotically inducible lipoprotein OsmB
MLDLNLFSLSNQVNIILPSASLLKFATLIRLAEGGFMKHKIACLLTCCLVSLLSACSTSDRRDMGLVGGGVLGGVAGHALTGGSTAGTVIGAVGGAFAGSKLAR